MIYAVRHASAFADVPTRSWRCGHKHDSVEAARECAKHYRRRDGTHPVAIDEWIGGRWREIEALTPPRGDVY